MSLPSAIFRNDESGRQLVFDRPAEIIVAHDADDFPAALEAAQAASDAGKWLAGYFSYEAGYLLEPKLVPLLPEGRRAPLVCLGIFDAPAEQAVPRRPGPATNGPIFDARAAWSAQDYAKRFARLHDHIRKGDCYQGNLTFPVRAQWSGDPLAAFDALTERQPVKYGALIALGDPIVLSRS
ncbi:aminodeoxychorismate synthase component I, partial [Mesorhizobium sp. M4B.F.Ca.ET.019.03.1.1]